MKEGERRGLHERDSLTPLPPPSLPPPQSDFNIKCYAGYHHVLVLALGIPGLLLFSVGVPVFSAWFIWRHRSRLHQKGFIRAYSFIYGDCESMGS